MREREEVFMRISKKIVWRTVSTVLLLVLMMSMTVFAADAEAAKPAMFATPWSLVPPLVAIVLALITKEVYSSLFIGILVGGLFYSNFSPLKESTLKKVEMNNINRDYARMERVESKKVERVPDEHVNKKENVNK